MSRNSKITAKLNREFEKYCSKKNINMNDVEFGIDLINEKSYSWRCFYRNNCFSVIYDKETQKCFVVEKRKAEK